jgi:hypothetical protein
VSPQNNRAPKRDQEPPGAGRGAPVIPGGTAPIVVLVISTIVLVVGGIAFLLSWLLGAFR